MLVICLILCANDIFSGLETSAEDRDHHDQVRSWFRMNTEESCIGEAVFVPSVMECLIREQL